jgi:SAM-dependent methyltransferase
MRPVTIEALSRAQETWDRIDIRKVRSVAWSAIPYFQEVLWRRFLRGAPSVHALVLELLAARLAARRRSTARGAALVCGDMAGERAFFETDRVPFERVDGYDLSPESLARYEPAPGLRFVPHVEDVNQLRLEPGSLDLVVGWHGLHHLQELDRVFAQAADALRPGGLLVMYEWVGPRALQIPFANRLVASALLLSLFPRPSRRRTHQGKVKGPRYLQDPPEAFDPSEACNSEALLPAFLRHFAPVRLHLHGALTYPMFEGLGATLPEGEPGDQRRFALVQAVEDALLSVNLVRPLFAVAIGEPRPAPRPP